MNTLRKKLLALFSVCISLLMVSCYTTRQVSMQPELEQAFMGKSHQDIVAQLGPPDRTSSDGAGGTILTYEHVVYVTNGTTLHFESISNTSMETRAEKQYVHLYINQVGVCYKVMTNYSKTIAEKDWDMSRAGVLLGLVVGFTLLFGGIGLIATS